MFCDTLNWSLVGPVVHPVSGSSDISEGRVSVSTPAESNADPHAAGEAETPRILTAAEFHAARQSPEFQELKRRFRKFVFPMTVAFLVWYFLYVLFAVYAVDFMSTNVIGEINVGLIFGVLQFVSTFGITALYIRFADRQVDPRAAEIRNKMESGDYR